MSECAETESDRELDIPYPKKLTIKKEPTMTQIKKVLYTAKTHTTGDRESGVSPSSDGRLDIKLSTPDASGTGTNPEQLLAAGWSACFVSSIKIVAARMKVMLPAALAVGPEGPLGPTAGAD